MQSTHTTRGVVAVCVVFAVLAFVGGYYYRGNKEDADASPSPTPSSTPRASVSASPTATVAYKPVSYTVKLTSTGLSPASLSIRVGDTVTMRNDTNGLFWPASNPHPTHTQCPGFDALRGLKYGESYTLTFSKVQTCGYHNNLAPDNTSMRGTITVR